MLTLSSSDVRFDTKGAGTSSLAGLLEWPWPLLLHFAFAPAGFCTPCPVCISAGVERALLPEGGPGVQE